MSGRTPLRRRAAAAAALVLWLGGGGMPAVSAPATAAPPAAVAASEPTTAPPTAPPTAAPAAAPSATPDRTAPPSPSTTPPADCPPPLQPPSAEQMREAMRQARDHGLLWRIERDGRVGWLFGSLHVGTLAWAFPGPQTRAAFAAADTLAVELDPTDAATQQALAAAQVPAPRDQTPALPAPLRERLAALARAECLPPLDALPALLQVVTLTVQAARRDALEAAYGQELVLIGMARAAGKQVRALESAASQMAMLMPPAPQRNADALAAQVDKAVGQLEDGRARRGMVRLAQAWADGDLDRLAAYAQWCECVDDDIDRAELRRLNDDRNPALASGIEALLGQGKRVFAAVGALHMTGAQALPLLLAQRGWRVERIVAAPR